MSSNRHRLSRTEKSWRGASRTDVDEEFTAAPFQLRAIQPSGRRNGRFFFFDTVTSLAVPAN